MKLFYRQEAGAWEETLPIGNGSLGGMIWGGVSKETIGLNEETVWSGYEREKNNPKAYACLAESRRLIFEGDYTGAEKYIQKNMLGEYNESYLPVGNLEIFFGGKESPENYERRLELDTATASVSYRAGNTEYRREYFASYPQKAIYMKLTASEPQREVRFGHESALPIAFATEENGVLYSLRCFEHVDPQYIKSGNPIIVGDRGRKFTVRVRILETDGEVTCGGGIIAVKNAGEITAAVSAVRHTEKLPDYETAKKEHIKDYAAIYNKAEIFLGEQPDIPTDIRLKNLREGKEDNGLYALYFQYGRYLMISSSRKGSLPANLQGIWNWELRAPWSSNWTTNINAEMNYWPVQSCGLEECLPPYLEMLQTVRRKGAETARVHFNCRGFCAGHNIDYWGGCNPVGIPYGSDEGEPGSVVWGFFVMAGAWMCQELWRQYEHHPDRDFLEEEVYPTLKEAAEFLIDWLVPCGEYLVTCPSTSPENRFLTKDGRPAVAAAASTLDMSIIREVFLNFRETCRLLEIDDRLLKEIDSALPRLYPYRIGALGQLQEWFEDFAEKDPGHRHLSHLYGLFPGELFENDETLKKACRISLDRRMEHGSGQTGWSCAWALNLYAVLGDRENAYKYLQRLLKNSTYDNLWDAHPPFQIDGNLGGIAGIANMLVQDRGGALKILPALPEEWKDGYVKGICIKGGRKIDIFWKNGKLESYKIHE